MALSVPALLRSTLSEILEKHGFVKARFAWQRQLKDVVWLVELDKRRAPTTIHLIRCGVWVKDLPGNEKVRASDGRKDERLHAHDCHVEFRLDQISRSRGKYHPDVILDSKTEICAELRRERIAHEFERFVFPTFEKLSTAADCCVNKPVRNSLFAWGMHEFCQKITQGIDTRDRKKRRKIERSRQKGRET